MIAEVYRSQEDIVCSIWNGLVLRETQGLAPTVHNIADYLLQWVSQLHQSLRVAFGALPLVNVTSPPNALAVCAIFLWVTWGGRRHVACAVLRQVMNCYSDLIGHFDF